MSLVSATLTILESAVVIGFALSFSTLLAYSVISGVIWMMQPRLYNEADGAPGCAASRRILGWRRVRTIRDDSRCGPDDRGRGPRPSNG
jgi:hypothetical protein